MPQRLHSGIDIITWSQPSLTGRSFYMKSTNQGDGSLFSIYHIVNSPDGFATFRNNQESLYVSTLIITKDIGRTRYRTISSIYSLGTSWQFWKRFLSVFEDLQFCLVCSCYRFTLVARFVKVLKAELYCALNLGVCKLSRTNISFL